MRHWFNAASGCEQQHKKSSLPAWADGPATVSVASMSMYNTSTAPPPRCANGSKTVYQACYGHAARARQALCAVTPSFQLRVVLQNACCKVLPLLAPPVVLASGSSCLPKAGSSALCRAHAVGRSSDPACVTLKNCLVSWYASLWSLSLYHGTGPRTVEEHRVCLALARLSRIPEQPQDCVHQYQHYSNTVTKVQKKQEVQR